MPTQTFFNLPEHKRQAIVDIAIEEFAEHDYKGVSISRIVERAGIAKGSFYQYFQDKKDLHLYLLQVAGEKKLELISTLQRPPGQGSFFDTYRWMMSAGIQFEAAHPELSRMAYRALYGDLPHRDETYARMKQQAHEYMQATIRQAIERGDLDPKIDPDMAAFVFTVISTEMGNHLFRRLGINPLELPEKRFKWNLEEIQPAFDQLFYILEKGMGPK